MSDKHLPWHNINTSLLTLPLQIFLCWRIQLDKSKEVAVKVNIYIAHHYLPISQRTALPRHEAELTDAASAGYRAQHPTGLLLKHYVSS
jgi:hypothetical protein